MELDRLNKVIIDIKNLYLNRDPEGPEKINMVITQIKDVYSRSWQNVRMPFIKEFCSRASQGMPVAPLSVCGRDTREMGFNKYLAYFLNPGSQHGLNDKLLRAILRLTQDDTNNFDLSNCIVETKKWMVGYNCDISITGQNYYILIEQKLFSSESVNEDAESRRLKRYNEAIVRNEEFNNMKIIKIYLTSSLRLPEAIEGWNVINYKDIIKRGIKLCRDKTLSRIARENLIRFLLELSPESYYEREEDLKSMLDMGNCLINDGFSYSVALQMDRLLNENKFLIGLLMEGWL